MTPKVDRKMFQIRETLQRGDTARAKRLTGAIRRLATLFEVS